MRKCIIVRYSEIGLKGKNKIDFERRLQKNIRAYLKREKIVFEKIQRIGARTIIFTDSKADLSTIPGIASYSYGVSLIKDLEKVKKEISCLIKDFTSNTKFKISTQRIDKSFGMGSMDVDRELGSFVVGKTNAKVDLKNPDADIGVEIMTKDIMVFMGKKKGFGGLPVGIEGKAALLVEDKNSIKAGELAMKRGCEIYPVGFKDKKIGGLQKFSPMNLNFTKIKSLKEIEELNVKAIVVGQTLKTFKELDTDLLILRPLIGA